MLNKNYKKDVWKLASKDKVPVSKSVDKAKEKWSKGKVQDKINDLIISDKAT